MVREGAVETQPLPPEDEEETGVRFNRRLLIGLAVVVLATAYLIFLALDAAGALYVTPEQVLATEDTSMQDRRLRVGGTVSAGSITRGESALEVRFSVQGEEGAALPVVYRGVPPDIFGEGTTVFIEGVYGRDGVFQADVLLARHPDTMEVLENASPPAKY